MSENCYVWGVPFGRYLHGFRLGVIGFALASTTACTSTVDSLGKDRAATRPGQIPQTLAPLQRQDSYDNYFKELLTSPPLSSSDVDAKVDAAFQQLFHGAPDADASERANQIIYYTQPDTDDEAYIYDFYHSDIRTEGMGLGMLIAVELDHQPEFDRLWNYAKRELQATGASSGYFNSVCDDTVGTSSCLDPYGMQMFAMSLIFAHDRWQSSTIDSIDYEADALALLDVMLHKEQEPDAIPNGITNTFDSETFLVFDQPKTTVASRTRPSILMPAFYELWYQATGNFVFSKAAEASRNFFVKAADSNTGLMPLRAYFDGNPVVDSSIFQPESYRIFPNMVLDEIWTGPAPGTVTIMNNALSFFNRQGIDKYGSAYYLDGTPVVDKTDHELALVIVNGMTAAVSTIATTDRQNFIQRVWDLDTVSGDYRYYQGILQLFALCVLSGKMQIY